MNTLEQHETLTERFTDLVERARDNRDLTRLWNWADYQMLADDYFRVMLIHRPEFFDDTENPNTAKFEY